MSLNSILQPAVAKPHFFCLLLLLIIARLLHGRRGSTELWIVVVGTSGIITAGLALFVLALLGDRGGPGIIPPIAFAGGFIAGFIAYLFVFVLALIFRPRPFRSGAVTWTVGFLSLAAFNSAFLALPKAASTAITVYIRSSDFKPIVGATLTYKTELDQATFSETTDSAGRIILHPKLGDTIDGKILPFAGFGEATLYIASPANRRGGCWGIQRHWSVPFGSDSFVYHSFFLTDLDDPRSHSIDVYLPPLDHAALLPYAALTNLPSRLQEAQRTGKMFNPEMNVQNLESYRQLSETIHAYDPHSSVRYYATNVFSYLGGTNQALESMLKQLSGDKVDAGTRDKGLAEMLSVLQIPFAPQLSWQERRDLIQKQLTSDMAQLRNVPYPK